MNAPLGYGLLGAGAFGSFCLQQYRTLPAIKAVAVADANPAAAAALAGEFGLIAHADFAAMLADPAVDLVHLATPPFTHAALVEQAVAAGKHVLCEKPLALSPADGRRMIDAARAADRVLAVNLIMRYDPLNRAVDAIIKEKLLGDVIAGGLLNLARDNQLAPQHWFWDRTKSGGISSSTPCTFSICSRCGSAPAKWCRPCNPPDRAMPPSPSRCAAPPAIRTAC